MSREVRRVPLGWQHPTEWREQWDRAEGGVRMQCLPRPLFGQAYVEAIAEWEREGDDIRGRRGWDWKFYSEYCLTGYQGRDDSEPTIHPYDASGEPVAVRDEAHLMELMLADHARGKPDADDFMPDFSDHDPDSLGWCMYETCSEGTPISPVMADPDVLAHWLADNKASAFGSMTATYEQWLATISVGFSAGSLMFSPATGLISGVAASDL